MSTDGLDTRLNTSQVLPYVFPMTTWKRHLTVWGKWGLEKWNDPVLVRTGVWTQVSLSARLLLLSTLYTGPHSLGQELSFQRAAAGTPEKRWEQCRGIGTIIKQLTATHFRLQSGLTQAASPMEETLRRSAGQQVKVWAVTSERWVGVP